MRKLRAFSRLPQTSIEHQAGTLNANGVDTGLTRAKAVQGLNDVRIGNTLLVGAGVALALLPGRGARVVAPDAGLAPGHGSADTGVAAAA